MAKKDPNVREKIIQAAYEVIQEKGYSATTLENIVQRAGLTRGAFYYYFNDKTEILRELEKCYESTYRHPYSDIQHYDSAYETIKALFVGNILSKKKPNPYAVMFRYKVEAGTQLEDMEEKQRKLDEDFIGIIAELIQEGIDKGEFNPSIDVQGYARSIFMMLLGYDTFLLTHRETPYPPDQLEQWASLTADFALNVLKNG